MYKTEGELGTAIKESGVSREKLFVTTKVDNANIHDIRGAIETSLKKLKIDYVDLCVFFPGLENAYANRHKISHPSALVRSLG